MRGLPFEQSYSLAADFVAESIKATLAEKDYNWYGVNFEQAFPYLIKRLENKQFYYIARNSSFLKIKHKIEFTKKFFNYENTGRKKEADKNIRKSETIDNMQCQQVCKNEDLAS